MVAKDLHRVRWNPNPMGKEVDSVESIDAHGWRQRMLLTRWAGAGWCELLPKRGRPPGSKTKKVTKKRTKMVTEPPVSKALK